MRLCRASRAEATPSASGEARPCLCMAVPAGDDPCPSLDSPAAIPSTVLSDSTPIRLVTVPRERAAENTPRRHAPPVPPIPVAPEPGRGACCESRPGRGAARAESQFTVGPSTMCRGSQANASPASTVASEDSTLLTVQRCSAPSHPSSRGLRIPESRTTACT